MGKLSFLPVFLAPPLTLVLFFQIPGIIYALYVILTK